MNAPAKEGKANAEVLEHMAKVLGLSRSRLQLTRGWSQNSKFLMVSGLSPHQIFQKLNSVVDQEAMLHQQENEDGPMATAGAAQNIVRQQWDEGDEITEVAAVPAIKQQKIRF